MDINPAIFDNIFDQDLNRYRSQSVEDRSGRVRGNNNVGSFCCAKNDFDSFYRDFARS